MNRRVVLSVLILVLMGATMSTAQKGAKRRTINLAGRTVQAPFSDGVLASNTLYLAGRIGLDPATGRPPDDLEKEIRLVLDGMKATLAEAGMTMDHIVYVQVFCPDVSLFSRFNAVYRTYYSGDFPARAFIGSGPLLFGAHFEVQAIAVKD